VTDVGSLHTLIKAVGWGRETENGVDAVGGCVSWEIECI